MLSSSLVESPWPFMAIGISLDSDVCSHAEPTQNIILFASRTVAASDIVSSFYTLFPSRFPIDDSRITLPYYTILLLSLFILYTSVYGALFCAVFFSFSETNSTERPAAMDFFFFHSMAVTPQCKSLWLFHFISFVLFLSLSSCSCEIIVIISFFSLHFRYAATDGCMPFFFVNEKKTNNNYERGRSGNHWNVIQY